MTRPHDHESTQDCIGRTSKSIEARRTEFGKIGPRAGPRCAFVLQPALPVWLAVLLMALLPIELIQSMAFQFAIGLLVPTAALSVVLGAWLVAAPFVVSYEGPVAFAHVAIGLLLLMISVSQRFVAPKPPLTL